MKGKIILGVVALFAVAGLYGLKEYFRTHEGLAGMEPVADLSVPQLILAFEKEPAQGQHPYVDKVIRVTGYVTGLAADDNPVVITLGEKGTLSSVQCSMDSTDALPAANLLGKKVTLKGLCTGAVTGELFGTDVKLSRCLLE